MVGWSVKALKRCTQWEKLRHPSPTSRVIRSRVRRKFLCLENRMIELDCTILFSLLSSAAVSKWSHTLAENESSIEL